MAETPQVVSFQEKRAAYTMDEHKKPVPAYTIEPMTRKTFVNRTVKDEIGFRVVPTEVVLEGYMVRTLRGDSAFLSHEDVVRLKLDKNLVPMLIEGGDDTPVGMQQVNAALSDKQKTALDVLTKLIESDPKAVEKLLAANAVQEPVEE
jgi:hypothetical protein